MPNSLRIQVTKAQVQAQSQGKSQQSSGGQATTISAENLFIRAIPSRERVRQGEQITLTYKLYTRVGISDYELQKLPAYPGFWSEDLEASKTPQVLNETYNGKQYRVVTLRKTALFATQTGSLKLEPIKVKCAVQVQARQRSNDPFDIFNDPFFSRFQTVDYNVESNAVTVKVDPLPSGAPEGFSGAVGRYTFSATVDNRTIRAGDPLTLRYEIRGVGNVKLVSLPSPTIPSDVEAYEPKVTDEVKAEAGVVGGWKKAEYLLVPRNPGQRVIEPVTFTYFDLDKNRYVSLRSPRFDITVTPGKEPAAGGSLPSKEDVRVLGEDIRFLKLEPGDLERVRELPLMSGWLIAGLLLPPLLFVGAFVYRRRLEAISGNLSLWRAQQAGKEASRRLKAARKLLTEGNTESYHAEISRAVLGYLRDKLRIPQAELTMETASEKLQAAGADQESIAMVQSVIERAEYSRFAPKADTREAREDLLDAAAKAINRLEKGLST